MNRNLRGYQDVQAEVALDVDVVIVGSGPGGAASARILAEGGRKVVVLEEGPAVPHFKANMPNTQRYHMQEDGMIVARGSGMMPIAAGRGVGGGSLVNSAICFRTPEEVLRGWIPTLGGDDRFSPEHLAPIFDELEQILGIVKTDEAIAGENNKLIVRGARKLGLFSDFLHRNAPT